jgi:hypothetical protein
MIALIPMMAKNIHIVRLILANKALDATAGSAVGGGLGFISVFIVFWAVRQLER